VRVDKKRICPQFLSWVFGLEGFKQHIRRVAVGATMPSINTKILSDIPVYFPPLAEQKVIASVLGALDDKIELNRRMNETLEAMARALFQSWFMDATQAGLPKGWHEVPLPEAIEVNPPRPLRKGEVAPYLDMANMPTSAARAMEVYDREFGSGMRFMDDDTLVARITPCLENGKTCFVDFLGDGKVGWGSTEYIVLHPKPPLPPEFAYFLARTENFRAFAISNMTGTSGRQRVPADCLNNFTIVVPSAEIAERFGQFVRVVFARLKANDEESRTLAAMRDALLPKLLSGELRATKAEEIGGGTA
jgi:type I restriction enzyme S subunit